jgi:pilus assembly protein Flp/PilA
MNLPLPTVKRRPRRQTTAPLLRVRLAKDSRGATAVEYGLILAMIVLVMVVALGQVADITVGMWGNVNTKVSAATGN